MAQRRVVYYATPMTDTTGHTARADLRVLPIYGMTGAYDVRKVEGAALIHLGDVFRQSTGEWTARPRNGVATRYATRRDAVAVLTGGAR